MANNTQSTTVPSAPLNTGVAGFFGTVTPMILMLVAFYFLLMRPQQKREAKRKSMIDSVKKDDKIVTASGIIGKIHKIVSPTEVSLEISEEVRIRILKSSISEILGKESELGNTENKASIPSKQEKSKKEKQLKV
jgi:preprotein translocase subunit YajC